MTPLAQLLEAALFSAARPLTAEELATLDPDATLADVRIALEQLREHYDFEQHGVELVELAGGYQILTRPVHRRGHRAGPVLGPRRRSSPAAALETLAVIAYRQPVGRAEIEEIRGVSAGGVLRSLQERGLIEVVGRSEALGRPLLYGTTPMFLELLGLRDLADLPRAEELTIALQPHRADLGGRRRRRRVRRGRVVSEMRLQRALARAGVASRRAAEKLISDGRVRVDGKVATLGHEGGSRRGRQITVGGQAVKVQERRWLAFHKPLGVVTTAERRGRAAAPCSISSRDHAGPHLRRPARRDDDRPAAAHHRRRGGAPADPPALPHSAPLHRAGARPLRRRSSAQAVRRQGRDRRPAGRALARCGCGRARRAAASST